MFQERSDAECKEAKNEIQQMKVPCRPASVAKSGCASDTARVAVLVVDSDHVYHARHCCRLLDTLDSHEDFNSLAVVFYCIAVSLLETFTCACCFLFIYIDAILHGQSHRPTLPLNAQMILNFASHP